MGGVIYFFYKNINQRLEKIEASLSRLKLAEKHTDDEEDYQLDYQNKGLSEDELEDINKELIPISKRLHQINTKIKFAFGTQIEEYSKPSLVERAYSITYLKAVFNYYEI